MIMKKYLFFIALFLFPTVLSAQPYFCDKLGAELFYVRTYVNSGDVKWTNTFKITGIDPQEDGSKIINYTVMRGDDEGEDQMKTPAQLSVTILANGDTVMSLGETMVMSAKSFFPILKVKASGADSILPNNMRKGDVLADASAVAKALGVSYNVRVIERSVIGEETITTPAGTFDCVIVQEHKIEKAPGYNRDTVAKTWYARGIGMVRHDTYNDGVRHTSEVLTTIK